MDDSLLCSLCFHGVRGVPHSCVQASLEAPVACNIDRPTADDPFEGSMAFLMRQKEQDLHQEQQPQQEQLDQLTLDWLSMQPPADASDTPDHTDSVQQVDWPSTQGLRSPSSAGKAQGAEPVAESAKGRLSVPARSPLSSASTSRSTSTSTSTTASTTSSGASDQSTMVVVWHVDVSLEALAGKEWVSKKVSVPFISVNSRGEDSATTQDFKIKILPGSEDGDMVLREGTLPDGKAVLYAFVLKVLPHPVFERKGIDLHTAIEVEKTTLVPGWNQVVQSLMKEDITITAELLKLSTILIFPDRGMPSKSSPESRGNLVVYVDVI